MDAECFKTAFTGAAFSGYDLAVTLAYASKHSNQCQQRPSGQPSSPTIENIALCQASRQGHYAVVRYLLERGADVEAVWDMTPLCYAACYRHEDIARLLLNNGAQIDSQASAGKRTALHFAIAGAGWAQRRSRSQVRSQSSLIAMLCARGADVNLVTDCSGTVLHYMVDHATSQWSESDHDILDTLFRYGARPEVVNNGGDTALMVASRHRYHEAARYLLERGADVHWPYSMESDSLCSTERDCFCLAMTGAHCTSISDPETSNDILLKMRATLSVLLEYGAEMNNSRIVCALKRGCPHLVDFLLAVDATEKHVDRSTLLVTWMEHFPAWQIHQGRNMVRTLTFHGADVDKVNSKGTTPFIDACTTGTVSDPNLRDENQIIEKLAIIKEMARFAGQINEPSSTGKSVLDIIYETPTTAYDKFHVLLQLGEYVSSTKWTKYEHNMMDLALELKHHSRSSDIRTWVWKAECMAGIRSY